MWIKLKQHRLLIAVVFLAAALRLVALNQVPASLDWDEVAIGWNAKTIWHTRRDEYGTLLPLSFKSFGDFKAPAYIYLTAPVVGLLGMNAFSVRLLSALAGSFSVALIYFIAQELFKKNPVTRNSKLVALISALLLAVTPWHLLMSRPAFEPNLALFFILAGTWLFLKGTRKGKFLLLSAVFFAAAFYSYHSPKIFLPPFLLGLGLIFRHQLFNRKIKTWSIVATILGLLLLMPLAKDLLTSQSGARFQGTSIFYTGEGESKPLSFSLVGEMAKNYLVHFSPGFLFSGGDDIPRVQMEKVGPLLIIQAPFLLWGLWQVFGQRRKTWAKVLLLWLFVGPLPAAIGFEAPHPIRAFQLLPVLTIVTALGLVQVKKVKLEILAALALLVNAAFFSYRYFTAYPVYSAPDFQYGYREAVTLAETYEDQVDKIIITSFYQQPHVFTSFYQQRDPQAVFWGAMSKYLFRAINWDSDRQGIIEDGRQLTSILLVGSPAEIPAAAPGLVATVNFPDGQPAFRLAKIAPKP